MTLNLVLSPFLKLKKCDFFSTFFFWAINFEITSWKLDTTNQKMSKKKEKKNYSLLCTPKNNKNLSSFFFVKFFLFSLFWSTTLSYLILFFSKNFNLFNFNFIFFGSKGKKKNISFQRNQDSINFYFSLFLIPLWEKWKWD